jgi:hypothetical protein
MEYTIATYLVYAAATLARASRIDVAACCALLFGRRCDLEQSLAAEVRRKNECILVFDHNCQIVRQTLDWYP